MSGGRILQPLLLLLLAATLLLQGRLAATEPPPGERMHYFPLQREAHWFAGSGYGRAVADLMWMKTLAYFGRHITGDRQYDHLIAMLDAITRINPHHAPAYRMAAGVLPWVLHAQSAAERLLLRAMANNPDQGIWPYYLAVNRYLFRDDAATAGHFMQLALQRGYVRPHVLSLAAKFRAHSDSLAVSRDYLLRLRAHSTDPKMREWIEQELTAIETEMALRRIERTLPPGATAAEVRRLIGRRMLPDGGRVVVDSDGTIHSSRRPNRYRLHRPAHAGATA